MNQHKAVQVNKLEKIGEDERGATYKFEQLRTGEFMVAERKAGSISGNHYHTGKHPYKRPEQLVLMKGRIMIHWRSLDGADKGSFDVEAPATIQIEANIWHQVLAIEDFVMLELNGTDAGAGDTFPLHLHELV